MQPDQFYQPAPDTVTAQHLLAGALEESPG